MSTTIPVSLLSVFICNYVITVASPPPLAAGMLAELALCHTHKQNPPISPLIPPPSPSATKTHSPAASR